MTDLVTATGASSETNPPENDANDTDTTNAVIATGSSSDGDLGRPMEWAPREPSRKKRRLGRWFAISLGLLVLILGLGVASIFLIAPGTSIAGVQVGGMTAGAAADAVNSRIGAMQITLTGAGSEKRVSGSDLGARTQAAKLAEKAFNENPMWNVTRWMSAPIKATITLDSRAANQALRARVPGAYQNATDATVSFNGTGYVATAAKNGSGIDLTALAAAVNAAAAKSQETVRFAATPSPTTPAITDKTATDTVTKLNTMLAGIGFYVGAERTVPIDPATAASWLTVTPKDGTLAIRADAAAIQKSVDTLAPQVNRTAVNATTIVNSAGEVLKTVTPGVTGRTLGDVSGVAAAFASQLAKGNAAAALPVKETPFTTTTLLRKIDVNLSTQRVTVTENGNVVDSWPISSGRAETATQTGSFTVNWKLEIQNMGNSDITKPPFYYQPDVPWVMYYNGDEALHGVYWHNNFGTPMSHGCVGMPPSRAKWLYEWTPRGTEVNVHY